MAVNGCQSANYPYTPISEHRPNANSDDFMQADPAIVSLYRWQSSSGEFEKIELPSEVNRFMVDGNTPIGFRTCDGQLLAIAGSTEIALPEGHYSWQILSEDPRYPAPQYTKPQVSFSFSTTGYDPQTDRMQTAVVTNNW